MRQIASIDRVPEKRLVQSIAVIAAVAWFALSPRAAHGEVLLRVVPADQWLEPGQEFAIQVRLDSDPGAAGDQGFPEGLFSYGFQLTFDPARVALADDADAAVAVPAPLDFTGFSPGARIESAPGLIVVKGNVNPADPARKIHTEPLLATVRMRDRAGAGTVSNLVPDVHRFFPTEDVFLTESGRNLDAELVSIPAVIAVSDGPEARLAITRLPSPGPGSAVRVSVSFPVQTGFDHWLERATSPGADSGWTVLAGAPHNSGAVIDDAGLIRGFYRLRLSSRN